MTDDKEACCLWYGICEMACGMYCMKQLKGMGSGSRGLPDIMVVVYDVFERNGLKASA